MRIINKKGLAKDILLFLIILCHYNQCGRDNIRIRISGHHIALLYILETSELAHLISELGNRESISLIAPVGSSQIPCDLFASPRKDVESRLNNTTVYLNEKIGNFLLRNVMCDYTTFIQYPVGEVGEKTMDFMKKSLEICLEIQSPNGLNMKYIIDFRGRIYPAHGVITHAASQILRPLFQFSAIPQE